MHFEAAECELITSTIFKSQLVSFYNVFKETIVTQGVKDGLVSAVRIGLEFKQIHNSVMNKKILSLFSCIFHFC